MNQPEDDSMLILKEKLRKLNETDQVLACLSEKGNHHTILQWRLKELMKKQDDEKVIDHKTFQWILSDVEILECILCSGYVENHRYKTAPYRGNLYSLSFLYFSVIIFCT